MVRLFQRRSPGFRLVSLVVGLVLLGSLLLPSSTPPLAAARSAAAPDIVEVTIQAFAFMPSVLTIAAGTTVRWTNRDVAKHNVTGSSGGPTLRSPLLATGESFTYTFQTPGTYNYICSLHPFMSGEIRVTGEERMTFPETGFTVQGVFFQYWRANGLEFGDDGVTYRESLALFGYPISGELRERLEDGQEYTVQYFERARFEQHPENAGTEYEVLLGQFGRRLYPADPPVAPQAGAAYFTQTGHNLSGRFRDYWQTNGEVPIFGYPISEVIQERLEDGREYEVQYFERARFEYHPENAAPYDVLLGQFGRRILAGR